MQSDGQPVNHLFESVHRTETAPSAVAVCASRLEEQPWAHTAAVPAAAARCTSLLLSIAGNTALARRLLVGGAGSTRRRGVGARRARARTRGARARGVRRYRAVACAPAGRSMYRPTCTRRSEYRWQRRRHSHAHKSYRRRLRPSVDSAAG